MMVEFIEMQSVRVTRQNLRITWTKPEVQVLFERQRKRKKAQTNKCGDTIEREMCMQETGDKILNWVNKYLQSARKDLWCEHYCYYKLNGMKQLII